MSEEDRSAPLRICEDEVLGKGGFGFVCKGEIQVSSLTAENGRAQEVSTGLVDIYTY